MLLFLGFLSAAFGFTVNASSFDAPIAPPAASLRIYDRDGALLRTVLSSDQTLSFPVSLESVSPWMIVATLATEDKRFFLHAGVDFDAVLRALWQNTQSGHVVSGASTLTEQLVKAMKPVSRNLWGKLEEMVRAFRLESEDDKREILQAYFNHVPYGNLCVGVEAASRVYFGVPASDLSLAQAAVLAAIPKSPTHYDPFRWPGAVLKRQRSILDLLQKKGWIDSAEADLAREEKITFKKPGKEFLAPHFTAYLLQNSQPGETGLNSTLDASLQSELQGILRSNLTQLTTHHVTNGALLVLDNQTGDVLAWVGSADFFASANQGQVDGVTALRQPGSSLKPFLYALAFSRGYKTTDLIQDEPLYTQGGFIPKNYDETYHGPVPLRIALACSYNIPAIRLAEKLSVDKVLTILRDFGFKSLSASADKYGVGLVLGNGEITMMESANAYATLARGGLWIPVQTLQGSGEVESHRVLDRESCYLVTSVLSDNSARAAAFGIYSPLYTPFPFAAKTGTTKDYRDNWAVGYTPQWTIAVWVGNFDGQPMRHISGITGAGPILHDAAIAVEKKYPSTDFEVPVGIQKVEVCPSSGKLPGPYCPDRVLGVYKKGFLPSGLCDVHKAPSEVIAPNRPSKLKIKFPKNGDVFKIDPDSPIGGQGLNFATNGAAGSDAVVWQVDGKAVEGTGENAWWNLVPGWHRLVMSKTNNGQFTKINAVSFRVLK